MKTTVVKEKILANKLSLQIVLQKVVDYILHISKSILGMSIWISFISIKTKF